jgi:DNA mismatch repair ATPase MutL
MLSRKRLGTEAPPSRFPSNSSNHSTNNHRPSSHSTKNINSTSSNHPSNNNNNNNNKYNSHNNSLPHLAPETRGAPNSTLIFLTYSSTPNVEKVKCNTCPTRRREGGAILKLSLKKLSILGPFHITYNIHTQITTIF